MCLRAGANKMNKQIEEYLKTEDLTRLANEEFLKKQEHSPLLFLNNTPIIFCEENEFPPQIIDVFTSDIISDDAEALVTTRKKLGTMIPNIKIGSNVSPEMQKRLAEPEGIDWLDGWRTQLVKTLVTGVKQRMNQLCATVPANGEQDEYLSTSINVDFLIPKDLQVQTDWSTEDSTPISDIQKLANKGANVGKVYDTLTLSTKNFKKIIDSKEFVVKLKELMSLQENKSEMVDSDGLPIPKVDVAHQLRTYVEEILGMNIVLEDTTFRVRMRDGKSSSRRYLKDNLVVLSSSTDDSNPMASDFGLIAQGEDNCVECYATFHVEENEEGEKEDKLQVWAKAQGFPRLHDKFRYATLRV